MPVDHEPKAASPSDNPGGEKREIGKRRRMDDVVSRALDGEVAEDAEAKQDRRDDLAPAAAGVELRTWGHGEDAHAGQLRRSSARPLASREVRHLVPVAR